MRSPFWLLLFFLLGCSQNNNKDFDKLGLLADSIKAKHIEITKPFERILLVKIHDSELVHKFLEQPISQNLSELDSTFYLSIDIGRKIHKISMHHFDYDQMLLSYQFDEVEKYEFELNFSAK